MFLHRTIENLKGRLNINSKMTGLNLIYYTGWKDGHAKLWWLLHFLVGKYGTCIAHWHSWYII